MLEQAEKTKVEESEDSSRELSRKLDALGWGLFFIWVGAIFLASIEIGMGLFGIGVIALVEQLARALYRLPMEGFWLFVGGAFVIGGLWVQMGLGDSLVPLGLIAIGAAIIVGGVRSKRPHRSP